MPAQIRTFGRTKFLRLRNNTSHCGCLKPHCNVIGHVHILDIDTKKVWRCSQTLSRFSRVGSDYNPFTCKLELEPRNELITCIIQQQAFEVRRPRNAPAAKLTTPLLSLDRSSIHPYSLVPRPSFNPQRAWYAKSRE